MICRTVYNCKKPLVLIYHVRPHVAEYTKHRWTTAHRISWNLLFWWFFLTKLRTRYLGCNASRREVRNCVYWQGRWQGNFLSTLIHFVILSWGFWGTLSRFLWGRLPRLYVHWRKGGFRTQHASNNSTIHFLVFEGLISSESPNLVSEYIAHIYRNICGRFCLL